MQSHFYYLFGKFLQTDSTNVGVNGIYTIFLFSVAVAEPSKAFLRHSCNFEEPVVLQVMVLPLALRSITQSICYQSICVFVIDLLNHDDHALWNAMKLLNDNEVFEELRMMATTGHFR